MSLLYVLRQPWACYIVVISPLRGTLRIVKWYPLVFTCTSFLISKSKSGSISVAISNIFFNSKHSVGFPTGSEVGEVTTCVGRAGTETTAWPLIDKLMACWFGADPLSMGTRWTRSDDIAPKMREGNTASWFLQRPPAASRCISKFFADHQRRGKVKELQWLLSVPMMAEVFRRRRRSSRTALLGLFLSQVRFPSLSAHRFLHPSATLK